MRKTTKILFLVAVLLATARISVAQTPYDDFAPNNQKREMLKLPETTFKVFSKDSCSNIKYIQFDKETYILTYYDKNDSLLESFQLNPTESKWLSVDPLAKKYPHLSPYNFVDNSPIRAVDMDGRDIIVLNNPNGASGYGHMGVLIGNDKTGWTFISKEGRDKSPWYSNELTGGPASKPAIIKFTSLDAFQKAQSMNDDKEINLKGYTQAVRFATDDKQDNAASIATQKAANSWYNVLNNNCADAVSDGLSAAGLNPGNKTIGYSLDDGLLSTGDPIKTTLDPRPTQRFNDIKKYNADKIIPAFPNTDPANSNSQSTAPSNDKKKDANQNTTNGN